MTRRLRIIGFGSAALLVLAGIAGAFALSGTLGQVLALVLVGLGLVLATALAFLEIGLSEEKERAALRGSDTAGARPRRPTRSGAPRVRPRRPNLGRQRGSRRRLG